MFRFADKYSQPLLSSLLGEGFSQVLSQNKVLWMKLLLSILFIIFLISSVATAKESTAELSGKFNAGDLSLHVECYGRATAISIVVSSGYNGYGSQGKWNKVINDVKSKHRICVYDRAGMGKSDRITEPYSYKKSAIRLKELLNNAGVKPPYIMIGHSKGSYPVRFYNDLFPDDVKGILLVDPSQYGQDYNMVAKWKPDLEVYAESINEQRLLELEVFNNPKNTTYNPFMIDLKKNELELKKTSTFGSVPFVLLWAKNGHSIGSVPSKDWHPDVWFRMAAMYKLAIENMHTNLSTDTTIAYSKTTEHDIFFVEPQAVVKQLELLSSKILQQP